MKKLILLLLLVPVAQSHAQSKAWFLYGEIGAGGGAGPSVKLDLNSLFLKNNIISAGYYVYHQRAINLPADYTAGAGLFGPNGAPEYGMYFATFMYGKMLYIRNIDMMRFSLKGGLAIGALSAPDQFTPSPQPVPSFSNIINFGSSPNYTYKTINSTIAGLVLNPSVEFPIGRGFGFRIGATGIFNSYHNLVNVEASLLFGKLRHRHPRNVVSHSNGPYSR